MTPSPEPKRKPGRPRLGPDKKRQNQVFTLPPQVVQAVKAVAAYEGISASQFAERALGEALRRFNASITKADAV